jgi:hypothetical protein
LQAIEEHLQMNVYTLSIDAAEDRRGQWVRHLPGNFNAGHSVVHQVQTLWPGVKFTAVIADYFRTPSAWAATLWTHAFYSGTIPALRDVLVEVRALVPPANILAGT